MFAIELQNNQQLPPSPYSIVAPLNIDYRFQTVFPAYVFFQYKGDDNILAFVMAYNAMAQYYLDWFLQTSLSIYTNDNINGALLDWVAAGIYGQIRPTLQAGFSKIISSAPNNMAPNQKPLNYFYVISAPSWITSDDVFKRILTWNFYKGDGQFFTIRWLKRRVMRFLIGENGTDPGISDTYRISITFAGLPGGILDQCNIHIINSTLQITTGAMPIAMQPNRFTLNYIDYHQQILPPFLLPSGKNAVDVLISAMQAGVLNIPFQFNFIVSQS